MGGGGGGGGGKGTGEGSCMGAHVGTEQLTLARSWYAAAWVAIMPSSAPWVSYMAGANGSGASARTLDEWT